MSPRGSALPIQGGGTLTQKGRGWSGLPEVGAGKLVGERCSTRENIGSVFLMDRPFQGRSAKRKNLEGLACGTQGHGGKRKGL